MNAKFRNTIRLLRKLPGVGPRQAARFVLGLLERDESELQELGQAILNLKKNIKLCKECFNLTDNSLPEQTGLCHTCLDPKRARTKLLVLEKVTDLDSIEKTGLYKGLYHVLGGAINPLDGMVPESLKLRELQKRVANLSQDKNLEIIVATNPNTSGETTALYIRELLQNEKNISMTRLGRGLASSSNLEYADELTLKHALESRR